MASGTLSSAKHLAVLLLTLLSAALLSSGVSSAGSSDPDPPERSPAGIDASVFAAHSNGLIKEPSLSSEDEKAAEGPTLWLKLELAARPVDGPEELGVRYETISPGTPPASTQRLSTAPKRSGPSL